MNYQSIHSIKGVMPTVDWFERIKANVNFKDKTVVDVGSCEGVFSYLIKKEGAKVVMAVEEQEDRMAEAISLFKATDTPVVCENVKIQQIEFKEPWDIFFLSMIIHWIGEEEVKKLLPHCNEVVIIFREKNHNYEIPTNGVWFPTVEELDKSMVGFKRKHSELLMTQNEDQNIILAIYVKA